MSSTPDTSIHVISRLDLLAIFGLDVCFVISILLDRVRVRFDFVEGTGKSVSHGSVAAVVYHRLLKIVAG